MTTTVDIPAMRVTLADGSFVDCSTAIPLYPKLRGIYNHVPLKFPKWYI